MRTLCDTEMNQRTADGYYRNVTTKLRSAEGFTVQMYHCNYCMVSSRSALGLCLCLNAAVRTDGHVTKSVRLFRRISVKKSKGIIAKSLLVKF